MCLWKFAAFTALLLLTGCVQQPVTLRQEQTANSSSGSYWEYELSTEGVLAESEYYETRFLGPGYTQHWEFEVVGEGNVTIFWKQYNSGRDFDSKHSYYVTYKVENHEMLFIGERACEPAETDTDIT